MLEGLGWPCGQHSILDEVQCAEDGLYGGFRLGSINTVGN